MRRLRLNPIEEICFRVLTQLCGVYHQPRMAMEVMNEMGLMGMTPNAVTHGHYNKAVLESKWPEPKEPSRALKTWQRLSLVLEVVRRFRQCGREAQTVNSFSRERSVQLQQQRNLNGGSKSELDNVSRSSQESGLSRASNEQTNKKLPTKKTTAMPPPASLAPLTAASTAALVDLDSNEEHLTVCENDTTATGEKAVEVNGNGPDTPATGTKGITRYSEIRGKFSNLLGKYL